MPKNSSWRLGDIGGSAAWRGHQRVSFEPQRPSGDGWINPGVPPPCGFIAATVDLAMVPSAQRNGELIADLAPECPALGKAEVVSIHGSSAADQAGVPDDRLNVLPITNPARFRQSQHALVDRLGGLP
jgi:hypothetical protein